jgi:hypothetical protein
VRAAEKKTLKGICGGFRHSPSERSKFANHIFTFLADAKLMAEDSISELKKQKAKLDVNLVSTKNIAILESSDNLLRKLRKPLGFPSSLIDSIRNAPLRQQTKRRHIFWQPIN